MSHLLPPTSVVAEPPLPAHLLLAAIVASSDDAIVSKNLNGIVTSWNQGAQRIFGYTAEEMIGQPIERLFPPDRLDEEPRILERLRRGERVDHYQTIRVRKNGEHFPVSLTISPIHDADGRVVGASKVARDITKEVEAVRQIERANRELQRIDQMKSEFLAVMSHELRTPLNSIIGFAGVLRSERPGPLTEDQKRHLGLIYDSGKHLLSLINDLLDLSRIEAGRLEIEPQEFHVEDMVAEAMRTLELQARQKPLTITVDVPAELVGYTDRQRLYQVVLNLLNNAIKFTPRGQIDITARQEQDWLVIGVRDTGIGIPRAKQSALFQPFAQVDSSARRRYDGTGLGLYLCRKLSSLLGGSIELESQHNRGSTFTVRVPIRYMGSVAGLQPALEPAFVNSL